MISLHSGIVDKSVVDIEVLPNGKFAMYLTNNEFDMNMVYNMIKAINTMDAKRGRSPDGVVNREIKADEGSKWLLHSPSFHFSHAVRQNLPDSNG